MTEPAVERVEHELVRGWLHSPSVPPASKNEKPGLVIAHGAGSNCESPLLIAIATAFAAAGYPALRIDLPYRQLKPAGPPVPGGSARDREGLLRAAAIMRKRMGKVILGGHSYGGRQSSMLAAERPDAAEMLLLLSYPLHPPRNPDRLRTAHFLSLKTPALFVHGTRDPFGHSEEMQRAITIIPGRTQLVTIAKAGHELGPQYASLIVQEAAAMFEREP